ncbi:MAG: L-tyrosine/L-tryptophan isonitrile synthase family protein [Deltaproteobacteria bacterium]|nr:L-tyrosine/L-tryptophan isonitrile synthase family protein [Deltaproteobacteria bacterium]
MNGIKKTLLTPSNTPDTAQGAETIAQSGLLTQKEKARLLPDAKGMYSVADPNDLPNPPPTIRFNEPLSLEEANRRLQHAGYAARIEAHGQGHRLVFKGGQVPLKTLDLQNIFFAVTQNKIRANVQTAEQIATVAALLDGGRTDRTWTEGDRSRPDLLSPRKTVVARTAVEPEYLGGPFALKAVILPKDRVQIDYIDPNLPPELQAYADHVIKTFDLGDGRVLFPVHNQQLEAIFPGLKDADLRTFQAQATSSDRTVAMENAIRLKMDLSQVNSINAPKPLNRDDALHDMGMWRSMQEVFLNDPVLRIHTATQPEVVAFTDQEKGITNLARFITPYPLHPQHPEGTLAVSLKSMLTETSGEPPMLKMMIENRPDQKQSELDYFVDALIRPLMKVFRRTLDEYGVGLYNLHEKNLAFETTLEMNPTGRVVINDFGDVWPDKNLMGARTTKKLGAEVGVDTEQGGLHPALKEPRALIRYGMNTLYDSLGAMASAFAALELPRKFSPDEIRNAVSQAVTQEMRFLRADTARILGTDHPMGRFVHHVSEGQQTTLEGVIEAAKVRTRERRSDPSLPKAAAVIDLDLCGLTPTVRAELALAKVGEQFGVPELVDSTTLPILPAYHQEGFEAFLEATQLRAKHPDKDWKAIQAAYEDGFFDKSLLSHDQVTAGLGDYVRRLEDAGATVYFITGRREIDRKVTEEVLKGAGILNPELLMMPNDTKLSVDEAKKANADKIEGEVLAVFDDLRKNRAALTARFPNATQVEVAIRGFTNEAGAEGHPHKVSSFEFDPRGKKVAPDKAVESFLSGARSVADLALAELSLNRWSASQAVTLSDKETRALLDQLEEKAIDNGKKLAQKAVKRVAKEMPPDVKTPAERAAYTIYDVLTHRPYVKGSRNNWSWEDARPQLMKFVEEGKPVSMILPSFPIKEHKDRIKAVGYLPDIAELGAFARMKELHVAIQEFHKPGLEFVVLMDGHHYRPHFGETPEMIEEYMAKLAEYAQMIGAEGVIKLVDYDQLALEKGGPDLLARRAKRLAEIENEYQEAFKTLDVTRDPIGALKGATMLDPGVKGAINMSDLTGGGHGQQSNFRDLFTSLVYMVAPPTPAGKDPQAWSKEVLSDIFNVTDPKASPALIAARKHVLKATWDMTCGYSSAIRTDRELKYSSFASDSIRGTIHPKEHQYGYALLGTSESHLTPWHGTGAIKPSGEISTDFVVSLQDQGFVPVYAPFLGQDGDLMSPRQPFAMVPIKMVGTNGKIKPEFWSKIGLPKD